MQPKPILQTCFLYGRWKEVNLAVFTLNSMNTLNRIRAGQHEPQAMEENNLRGFQEVFKRVVVCHIDKHNSEGLLI